MINILSGIKVYEEKIGILNTQIDIDGGQISLDNTGLSFDTCFMHLEK